MSDISWIKLKTNTFDDPKMKIVNNMPEGDAIQNLFIRLICLAGEQNNDGSVTFDNDLDQGLDEQISAWCNKELNKVRLAITILQKLKMINIKDKVIYIVNFEKHQNIEGMERIRQQTNKRVERWREKQKKLLVETVTPSNVTVTQQNRIDKNRIDKNRIDKEVEGGVNNTPPITLKEKNLFQIYEETIGELNSYSAERLKIIANNYPEKWFRLAVLEAQKYQKMNLPYIDAILKNWEINGVKNGRAKQPEHVGTKFGEIDTTLDDEE